MGYREKIWTHGGPRKKIKKIAMLSKEFTERDHTKEMSFYFIHHNSYTCTS